MFLSYTAIESALASIERVHVFYGTTFLACKRKQLPIANSIEFAVGTEIRKVMDDYYKPYTYSEWYYRAFRHVQKDNHWLRPNWPTTSAQSTMTRDFGDAFHHESKTRLWSWRGSYVEILKRITPETSTLPVPMFNLASWLYRNKDWSENTKADDVLNTFLKDFHITSEEMLLFDMTVPIVSDQGALFRASVLTTEELASLIGLPPDAPQEEGGTLAHLALKGIGPSTHLRFNPAERLSLITGDNGLGKTFLLECAWWALTGRWAGYPAFPRQDRSGDGAEISFQIAGSSAKSPLTTVQYDLKSQSWPSPRKRPTLPGLLIYARVDGSFAVYDPAQRYYNDDSRNASNDFPQAIVLGRDQVWNGYEIGDGAQARTVIGGLIRDVVQWQYNPSRFPLAMLERVLIRLSPSEIGPLRLGEPSRLPYDRRDLPTLSLPYGDVPVVHAAAGMRRILTLAYLIVWAWDEHTKESKLARHEPQRRMVIMIDEIEAHLHPQWQRLILPALLGLGDDIGDQLQVQHLVTTHSPLVTASLEPFFDLTADTLYHLNLSQEGALKGNITLEEVDFVRQGTVDSWLTADSVFGLDMARSVQAEDAIKQAKELQTSEGQVPASEVKRVSDLLIRFLSDEDEFWPRWTYFAKQHGIDL